MLPGYACCWISCTRVGHPSQAKQERLMLLRRPKGVMNFCCDVATDAHVKHADKQYREVHRPRDQSMIFRGDTTKLVNIRTCSKDQARDIIT